MREGGGQGVQTRRPLLGGSWVHYAETHSFIHSFTWQTHSPSILQGTGVPKLKLSSYPHHSGWWGMHGASSRWREGLEAGIMLKKRI